jgi:pimeloyl-ACP methyl ester carboxylesterase
MSHATASDGVRVHYRSVGRPDLPPLVMLQGLGTDLNGWFFQRLAFAHRFRVICIDNRGAGRSGKPRQP